MFLSKALKYQLKHCIASMQGLRAEQHTLPLSDENRSGAQMCKLTHLVSIVFGSQSLGRKVLACLWRGNCSQDQRFTSSIHAVCPGYRPLTPFGLAQLGVENHVVVKVIGYVCYGSWVWLGYGYVCNVCCTISHLLCFAGRLKAAQGSKTITSLLALNCQRRILLTGTPVQNNLDEFFGELGVIKTYKLTASLLLACVHARLWADGQIWACLDMLLQRLACLPASYVV